MPSLFTAQNINLYKRLLSYLKVFWFTFVIAMIGNILYSALNAGATYLLKPILDKGFVERDLHFIEILPILILGVFALRGVIGFIADYFMAYVSRGVVMKLRQEIFDHLLKLPANFYDHTASGKLLSLILYNVEQVANAGSDTLTTLVQSFYLIIGLLIVMFSISWQLSLLFLLVVPAIAGFVHFGSKRLRQITLNLQKKMGDITHIVEEAIEGYKIIRVFGGQGHEHSKFYEATKKNRHQELKVVVTKSFTISMVQFIAAIALSLTIYLATGTKTIALTAGAFASLIAAMWSLLRPLRDFTKVNTDLQRGLAGAETVFGLLDEPKEADTGKVTFTRVKGAVSFQHVFFSYSGDTKTVLRDMSFSVKPGQVIALVGRSGSGKTTIINLLQRFYQPTSGTITVDGIDIQSIRLDNFRQQFAIVSQRITLFNDTIRNNIIYGQSAQVADSEIIEASKTAHAWDFIEQMPAGLDTLVGENGVLLSGGQRQRIAIARAILKKAPILILDEATSSLDTESERKIQEALDHLIGCQTTFIVAHRLSTIERADLILVIEKGSLIEVGNHETLIKLNGYYANHFLNSQEMKK